ncbi:ABC transporter ATP-binding protein [Lentibacillus saliphilus]|uniref:ABC transporter ATP-binding protein n=1 Tax=Lentibacillus saliphilus TaxID=2737028 RepID=UPI001C303C2F|nr:ABC transporter ATP-binding protein [Lentibacillus saliphilus]
MHINVEGASVIFGDNQPIQALKDVSLQVAPGEWVNILGPSGSGKTTLLNVIGGLEQLYSGSIKVDGKDIHQQTIADKQNYKRTSTGYIFQDYRLFDQFTVLENVMLPQWPYEDRKKIEKRSEELLEQLQMSHRKDALPEQLSGGEKQRTAIARALLGNPSILLCDEPTGNLDEANRETILHILFNLQSNNGMTIILVTHDPEVAKWGDRNMYIRDGCLQGAVNI